MFRQHRVHSGREFYEIAVEQVQAELLLLSRGKSATTAPEVPSSPSVPVNVDATPARDNTNASVLGFPYWTRFNEMRSFAVG